MSIIPERRGEEEGGNEEEQRRADDPSMGFRKEKCEKRVRHRSAAGYQKVASPSPAPNTKSIIDLLSGIMASDMGQADRLPLQLHHLSDRKDSGRIALHTDCIV